MQFNTCFDKIPQALVTKGRFNNGVYNELIDPLNPLDASIFGNHKTPRWLKKIRLKEWHAYMFGDQKFFCVLVLMNLKKSAMIELVVYDIDRKMLYKHLITRPISSLHIGENLKKSSVSYKDNNIEIDVKNLLEASEIYLNFSCILKNGTSLKGSITGNASCTTPLIACMPLDEYKSIYTHKQPLLMSGSLQMNQSSHQFQDNAFMIVDDQKAYYPRHFWWHWLTSAKVINGTLYGFNLTENQSSDPQLYNENCMWFNNKTYRLPPVQFSFDREAMIWNIKDKEGMVDLTFNVVQKEGIKKNFILFRTNYYAPFGLVSGTIKTDDLIFEVENYFSMGELNDVVL